MTASWWEHAATVGQACLALMLLGAGAVGLVRCHPSGERAREQPGGASAWRIVSVALVLSGAGQLLSSVRNLPQGGWGLWLSVAGVVLIIVAGVVGAIGLVRWRRDRVRTGVLFEPFTRRPSG